MASTSATNIEIDWATGLSIAKADDNIVVPARHRDFEPQVHEAVVFLTHFRRIKSGLSHYGSRRPAERVCHGFCPPSCHHQFPERDGFADGGDTVFCGRV
jgi:hypothetical protein